MLGFIRADQVPSERNEEDEVIGERAKDYEHLSLGIQTWSMSGPILVSLCVLQAYYELGIERHSYCVNLATVSAAQWEGDWKLLLCGGASNVERTASDARDAVV